MALHFQLLDKTTGEAQPLAKVDDRICIEVLNCTPHERHYGGTVFNWFDSIGFQIASGKSLEDNSEESVRKYYQDSEMWQEELPVINKIIDFMQANYTTRSWSR